MRLLPIAVSTMILALAAGAAQAQPPAPATRACRPIPVDKIGLQLYSMNPAFYPGETFNLPPSRITIPAQRAAAPRTPRPPRAPVDPQLIDSVLGRLEAIGYRNVELAGTAGATPQAFAALLDKHRLKVIGSHNSLDPAGWDAVLADAVATKQGPFIGSGNFGPPGLTSLDEVKATARNLNELGRKALAKGLRFYVHNHTGEFDARYPYDINKDGKLVPTTAWEIIAAETDPRYVNFEVDVHWARRGFNNDEAQMLAFIRKYQDRVVLLHIKDTAGDLIADLGRGDTNWPLVYAAAPKAAYYIWEHDAPADPLKSAEIAFKYLTCAR